jgi:PAS domain S-box-containing protein
MNPIEPQNLYELGWTYAPGSMFAFDSGTGELINVNQAAEALSGYSCEELIRQPLTLLHPEAERERVKAEFLHTLKLPSSHPGFHIQRKDGRCAPVAITSSGSLVLDGRSVTICIYFDITMDTIVHNDADKHLAQMEARYRGLMEAAPDGMVVVNQGGEIVLLNARAETQFGYRRDELLGQMVKSIIPEGLAERLTADGTRTEAEALAQQIGTGIELNGRRKDGTEFPIDIMLSPLESPEGILITAAIRDISLRKDAEKHLAQMEGRYRGLLEAAPDGMVVVNQSGEIVLLNAQAEKRFGYHRDELLGQKVTNIIPKGFAERLIADGTRTAAEALAQQIGTGIELIGRRKDGSEFPIEIMLSPLESSDGILVTAALRDITIRKDADKHLAQMESRYRGLMEAAPDGMVVVNQSGEIVLLNAQAEKQFGYRRDELLGQKVTNIIPEGFAERLIADGTRTAAEALAQQIGTGIELNGLRKDGTGFPIEMMLSPLESTEGVLVTAAIRDITVRKDAEKHLEQMEARYRGLLEAAPDGMVVVNQGAEIVLLNAQAEKQFGYSRDELLGQKVTSIIPQGFAERLIADGTRTAAEALAQQIGTGIELIGLRKDGTEFPIEIMLSPLESPEGILVTAAIRDITVQKEREHHIKAQNWALSAYAGAALALAPARDSQDLLRVVCEAITTESIYVLAFVGIAEDGPGKPVRIAAATGSAASYLDGLHLSWAEDEQTGKAAMGACIRTGKIQNVLDSETSETYAPWRERAKQYGIRSVVCIPLLVENGWRGVLNIYAAHPNAFEAPAIEVFQHLAEQIVHAAHALDQGLALDAGQIDLANMQRQLTDALSAMVAPMVAAMEMRDPYTAGHESRVGDIAVAIGKEMGWPEERLHGLYVAGQVHDIGKISIPAEILTKPTKLSAGEWALIREHPETGYTILKNIPFPWPIAEIVRQHHERLDGSGYPLGLKEDTILPEAKVLAVADVVEAMASHRPYRPAIKLNIVLKQIERDAGSKLDAEAVRVCAALFREKRLVLSSTS